MRLWVGYGSEHSMNLVMIGHFKEAREAEQVKRLLDHLAEKVAAEQEAYRHDAPPHELRFSDEMMAALRAARIHGLGPSELEQFNYDVRHSVEDKALVIRTDESDVSAFLKVLLERGARIEVYSAHDYPDAPHGRGRR